MRMQLQSTERGRSKRRLHVLVCCSLFIVLFGIQFAPASFAAPLSEIPAAGERGHIVPNVSTVAGSGQFGIANGAGPAASFMEPSGIAVSSDGSIYVSDASAQEIRRIRGGSVELFAGASDVGHTSQSRIGGYQDGPLKVARFNRPAGLALARDGTLYVADLMNHCIRKIFHNSVSTLAGTGVAGSQDGPLKSASFNAPLAVSVDDDGDVFVADYGNGIRKIGVDGIVSTLALPTGDQRRVLGVSAKGAASKLKLAWTTKEYTFFQNGTEIEKIGAIGYREPTGENLFAGRGDSIVIVGLNSVVDTDLMTNCVRFIQFQSGHFDTAVMERALAGGIKEGDAVMGGYRDGPSDVALVDAPEAVAAGPDGSIYVADAGNRRVRRITSFDTRGPLLADYSNLVGPGSTYRIVVVGNSVIFNNVLWGESIPGMIEAGLTQDIKQLKLGKPVSLTVVRLDASSVTTEREFIRSFLGDGEADLVILVINPFSSNTEISERPNIAINDAWKTIVPQELLELDSELRSNRSKLMLVTIPEGQLISHVEVAGRSLDDSALMTTEDEITNRHNLMVTLGKVYASSKVQSLDLIPAMIAYETSNNRPPLFNTEDIHLTVDGAVWVGKKIRFALEKWKPWLNP